MGQRGSLIAVAAVISDGCAATCGLGKIRRMPNGIGVEPPRAQAWRAMRFQALDSVTHAVLGERCDRRGERERRLNTYTDAQRSCPKLTKTGRFMFFPGAGDGVREVLSAQVFTKEHFI